MDPARANHWVPGARRPLPDNGNHVTSAKGGSMQSIYAAVGIARARFDDSMPPKEAPRVDAHPSGIGRLQLKWDVGVTDLNRE